MLKSISKIALNASALGAVTLAVAGMIPGAAEARIRCDGAYQIVPGAGPVSTPYCRDLYLSRVARRSYGVSTSFAAIRNSVHEKQRVCRMIGHDSRVNELCIEFFDGRSGADRR